MRNADGLRYYPAPVYHDAPTYFDQSERMLLLSIRRHQTDCDEAMIGRVQVMVFPSTEIAVPRQHSADPARPMLPSLPPHIPSPRRGELVPRAFPAMNERVNQMRRPQFQQNMDGWQNSGAKKVFDVCATPSGSSDAPVSAMQLFADPGLLRILRLSDFQTQLRPQVLHPERLQESHRLPCYVQVFEITQPGALEEFTTSSGLEAVAFQFGLLEDLQAEKLQLRELPQSNRCTLRRAPGLLLPGDRVFRLQVVRDPTVICPEPQSEKGCSSVGVIRASDTPEHFTSKPLKRSIPESYLSPWEFEKTRDEALRELTLESSGWLRNLVRAVRSWTRSQEVRDWKSTLIGKSVEDQLWGVPPPKWALKHRAVQKWARRTLALAGYDSEGMFPEWEIFWRRKGF